MSEPTGPDPAPVLAEPDPEVRPAGEPGIAVVLALYTLARLGLLAAVAGLLLLAGTPLVISVLVALIVALPLSMLLFRGLRARLDAALAVTRVRRGAERAALRARLRGAEDGAGGEDGAGAADAATVDDLASREPAPVDAVPDGGRSGDRAERQADGRGD
jgi:Protein of unknown function (DUF4229)